MKKIAIVGCLVLVQPLLTLLSSASPAQSLPGPDLTTTVNWISGKLNSSVVQIRRSDVLCRPRTGDRTQVVSQQGLVLHIHEVRIHRCGDITHRDTYDYDLPLYAIDYVSASDDEAVPVSSMPERVSSVLISTEKNDISLHYVQEILHQAPQEPYRNEVTKRVSAAGLFVNIQGEDNQDLATRLVAAFLHARDLTRALRPRSAEPF
jgi:hypothetical protein